MLCGLLRLIVRDLVAILSSVRGSVIVRRAIAWLRRVREEVLHTGVEKFVALDRVVREVRALRSDVRRVFRRVVGVDIFLTTRAATD